MSLAAASSLPHSSKTATGGTDSAASVLVLTVSAVSAAGKPFLAESIFRVKKRKIEPALRITRIKTDTATAKLLLFFLNINFFNYHESYSLFLAASLPCNFMILISANRTQNATA